MERQMVMRPNAITTEVVRSKLEALDDEMLYLLYRSAYSTLMRESRDCSYQMTAPSGALVTDGSVRGQYAIEYLINNFSVQPNDIWISNHPYQTGVQHTPDLMVTVPVVHNGVQLGFSSTVAHKSDSGGALVGSVSMQSTEIFQEGLLLPFMKVGEFTDEGFELDDRIIRMISTNVRDPDLYIGDFRAQVGVSLVGRKRIQTIADEVGTDNLLAVYEEIQNLGERMIRRHLAGWTDGEITVEAFLDSDGVNRDRPVRYELKVTKVGSSIEFDFSGSDDQTVGPVNILPPYMEGYCIYPSLLSMTDPTTTFNSGICRAVKVIERPGSVFNPHFPAPVGATTTVSYRVTDMVLEALSYFAMDRAVGNSGGAGGSTALLWQNRDGARSSRSMQYEVLMTAQGAASGHDGCSGTGANFYNSPLTPIEILEAQFPVRIERFELIKDSGGPGKFRGGLSYRRQYVCLAPATLNRRADRGKFPAKGIHGGKPGSLHRLILNPFTEEEKQVPIAGRYEFAVGESFMGEGAGAGGYGDPMERDPLAVVRDVASEYVSKESAERDYGVVLFEDGSVDESKTAAVRASSRVTDSP
jgi:N-methylhydantoinase B